MKKENKDANKMGSWYMNKNEILRKEVEGANYKRLMTLMGYSQVEHRKRLGEKLYENSLRRDGIVVSVANFIPSLGVDYSSLDSESIETLDLVNKKYGQLDGEGIDRVHLDLLDLFHDPGPLKED